MIITVFAIIGAFWVTLFVLILFTALSRLFIAVGVDVLILMRQSFNRFSNSHRDTSGKSRNKEYKFHPVHYVIYSFQFLNTPVCFLCAWLHKLRLINQQCNKKNKEATEENPIGVSPRATSHVNSLTRGSINGQPNANRGFICFWWKMKHFNKIQIITLVLVMYLVLRQYPRNTSIYEQGFIQVVLVMVLFCFSILAGRCISEKIKIYQKSHPNHRPHCYSYVKNLVWKILPRRFRMPNLFSEFGQNNPDMKVSPSNKAQDTQTNPLYPRHRGILKEAHKDVNQKQTEPN